jgi:general secretion pathway protein D
VQRFYEELMERLDKRRAQVLIDAKVVIIDTSDDFSLGVEISGGDSEGGRRLFGFSSFGLSEVDAATGALSLVPGLGFNGTLVDPEIADVVLRALSDHHRSRVTSAPRVLVNDNAEGQLSSVAEVPFTSINASDTVATTSFAGFAQAGTTITVTPHISDDNHLQLEFAITLNTFTGAGSQGVPPPRQTDEVRSQVTIPDGYTVIVGGLNRTGNTWDFTSIPFIDQIPLLRYLGGSESRNTNSTSMFVFLKPIILRDDKFRDLKYLSDRNGRSARNCPELPTSQPVWMTIRD